MQGAKTVDQALVLLLALGESPHSVTDLASATGLNRTVVHRMLITLHERGFVRRNGSLYAPGAVFLRLASSVEPTLRTEARPRMQALAAATGETAVLTVADGLEVVAIEQVVGRNGPVRVEYELGSRRPIAKGASGRALLAYLDDDTVQRVLATVDDPAAYSEQLAGVRELGYALSRDELRIGVHGIAAPVHGGDGVIASLSVIVPATRDAALLPNVDHLLQAAHEIEQAVNAAG